LQQLQLELHLPCAPIQDVKGWQPPLLNELEFGSHQC
jgi:hypothetical protein